MSCSSLLILLSTVKAEPRTLLVIEMIITTVFCLNKIIFLRTQNRTICCALYWPHCKSRYASYFNQKRWQLAFFLWYFNIDTLRDYLDAESNPLLNIFFHRELHREKLGWCLWPLPSTTTNSCVRFHSLLLRFNAISPSKSFLSSTKKCYEK